MTTTTKPKSVRAKAKKANAPAMESIVNNAPRRFADADWPVGSVAHQGDVILVRIAELTAEAKPRKNRQVADGNTQGSRHILEGGKIYDCNLPAVAKAIKAACPRSSVGEQYIGPVFLTDDTTALRHPEHGDHEYDAGMCVAVVFQRNLDAEQREQVARD